MIKKLAFIIYKLIFFLDIVFNKITKRSILIWFKEFIQNDSYTSIKILNKKVSYFVPNQITKWRVDTFFIKEPETLDWIDSFSNNQKIIFWDIGANIGLYSIYAALKYENIEVISFEPSTSNLRVLSRNISINNLQNKIKINQFPLSNRENQYLLMKERDFVEGGALNSFGESFGFDGKNFESNNNYQIYGTTINYLLKNKILQVPNYIKIDVDGIEHLILKGANNFLKNIEIKSLSIELNQNFTEQYNQVIEILQKSEFKFKHKKHSEMFDNNSEYSSTFNYVFER